MSAVMSRGDELQNKERLRRVDSLDVEASHIPSSNDYNKGLSTVLILRLAFESLGVIYGDLGTSPLYVYSSTFPDTLPGRDDVIGSLCLIIYTLTLIPLIKYVIFVLRANDHGNGGTFALYSLICRHARVSWIPNEQEEDRSIYRESPKGAGAKVEAMLEGTVVVNGVNQMQSEQQEDSSVSRNEKCPVHQAKTRGVKIKEALEGSVFAKWVLLLFALLGTCAVMGDGVLTPVISVISAVDGIQTKKPSLTDDNIVLISIAILVVLFSLQRFGTEKVAFLFAPWVLVWFLFISGIGIFNIFKHDLGILRAFNPYYIIHYFRRNGKRGWTSLGGIVLAITGTEAMFADVGHFSVPSVRIAFSAVVYPSLLAAYIGQGAFLLKHPEYVGQTFYKSIPEPMFWPMFVIAIGAAIIASQAMISAVFSIVEQSLALGCFPTVKVVHTSSKFVGQVYIPEVNWVLMILCVITTAIFKTTEYLGNAYGLAVLAVMLVTTTLLTLIMLMIWETKLFLAVAFFFVFGTVEFLYFTANLYKFKDGGWLPVAFSCILLVIMAVWQYVSSEKYKFESDNKVSITSLVKRLDNELRLSRVPGIGLMYTQLVHGVPPIFDLFVDNVKALHSVVIFVSVKHLPIATVLAGDRFLVRRVGSKEHSVYRAVARYGYKEALLPHRDFENLLLKTLREFLKKEASDFEMLDQSKEQETYSESGSSSIQECQGNLQRRPSRGKQQDKANGSESLSISEYEGDLQKRQSGSNKESNATSTTSLHRKEEQEREWDLIRNAMKEGVSYLLGNSVVVASPTSSIAKRFVVNVLYDILQRISRKSRVALQIPHKNLVEVGITYTL